MEKIISAIEFKNGSDSERIQSAINKAVQSENYTVIIPKNDLREDGIWEIDKAIELPSNAHVLLDGAHLRLKDGIYDNIFRSQNLYNDKSIELSNITIKGINNAILDGGVHNGLRENNHSKDGKPHIYFNNLILLFNVTNYEISNLSCINPRYWCINQIYCTYGMVKNINFLADGLTANQDGINLRVGCHHVVVDNITGRTGDDSVAITAVLPSYTEYILPTKNEDVHHVIISNVKTTTHQTIVALRTSDGIKLHDILVDGVQSTYDEDNPETFLPWGTVRVGESLYYRLRPSVDGEIYNITVKNVLANSKYGIALANSISDSTFENITAVGKCPSAVMTDVKWWLRYADEGGGVSLERCLFRNVTYSPDSTEPRKVGYYEEPVMPAVFLFNNMKKHNFIKDVYIDEVKKPQEIKVIALPSEKNSSSLFISNVK